MELANKESYTQCSYIKRRVPLSLVWIEALPTLLLHACFGVVANELVSPVRYVHCSGANCDSTTC